MTKLLLATKILHEKEIKVVGNFLDNWLGIVHSDDSGNKFKRISQYNDTLEDYPCYSEYDLIICSGNTAFSLNDEPTVKAELLIVSGDRLISYEEYNCGLGLR